jgi:putative peptidoglycan lipid II flippase
VDRSSALVAFGILCSRLTGFVRQRVFAHYFGLQTDAADAFMAAFRIPNFLQNLFGEGALSASFIPVYATLVARNEREAAARVAGAVAALLALMTSVLVLAGVVATPLLVGLIAPGFRRKRALTIAIASCSRAPASSRLGVASSTPMAGFSWPTRRPRSGTSR